jgi:hypothetical protein
VAKIHDPSRPLKNAKQEAFCRFLATPDERGRFIDGSEAARKAGYSQESASNPSNRAYRLLEDERVRLRYEYLLERIQGEIVKRAESAGIAIKANRIARKNRSWNDLQDLIEARKAGIPQFAKDAEDLLNERLNLADQAAATTDPELRREINIRLEGLDEKIERLLAKIGIGEETGLLTRDAKGAAGILVEVVKFDKAVLDAINDLENDAAKEMGQLITRINVSDLTNQQIVALLAGGSEEGG